MKRSTPFLTMTIFLVMAAAVMIEAIPTLAATTITVNSTADVINSSDGLCSLREAIIAHNTNTASGAPAGECVAGGSADEITFSPSLTLPATFSLALAGKGEDAALTGDLDITGSTANTLLINGGGRDNTIIDGSGIDRVFDIQSGARVTLAGLAIRNGDPGAASNGGGFAVRTTGRLTLNDSIVIGNSATVGGGAHVLGLLSLNDSTVEANTGGGVYNQAGLLIFSNSQVLSNTQGFGVSNLGQGFLQFNGGSVSHNDAGGIENVNAQATLDNLTIAGNTVGGGLLNDGGATMTIRFSSIFGNAASVGGGITNQGSASLSVFDSQISYNQATIGGGGGISNGATLKVERSTIDNNQATSGGGINHIGSGNTLVLKNVTISGNTVSDNGGGLYSRSSASLTNVTLTGNSASGVDTGANIFNENSLSLENSIVANPLLTSSCANDGGTISSLGHNLDSGTSCGLTAGSDITNANPNLGPLQDNGGLTWTHALLAGSQAIDNGNNGSCPPTDQRGVSRPQGTACDIGAYEYAATADLSISKARVGSGTANAGQAITFTVAISNAGPTSPISATVVDTWSPTAAVIGVDAPNCTVNLGAGTATCTVQNLGVESRAVPDPHIVLTTSATYSGALSNSATVSVLGGVTDLNPGNDSAGSVVVNVIAPPIYGVSLSQDQAKAGSAGQITIYTLQLTNSGNTADTFSLGAGGNSWSSSLSSPSVMLPAGMGSNIQVTVTVPITAGGNVADTVTVTATSTADPSKSDLAYLTTSVPPLYGVALPADLSQAANAGETISYTVFVTNTGNVSDTILLNASGNVWTTDVISPSVRLDASQSVGVPVEVTIPLGATGIQSDTVTIEAASQTASQQRDTVKLSSFVLPFYGVDLAPNQAETGTPGETVLYALNISNTGNLEDSFILSVGGNAWTTAVSSSTITIAPFASGSFTASVTVPAGAMAADIDTATVSATSTGNGAQSDSVELVTSVTPVYGVALSPDQALTGVAGQTVTYTVRITNSGNITNTFNLTRSLNGWSTSISATSVQLAGRSAARLFVTVEIPVVAMGGDADVTVISASSLSGGGVTTTVSLTTTVPFSPVHGLELSPDESLSGEVGATVTYTLWLTNVGNVVDTFNLVLSGNGWPTTVDPIGLTLPAQTRGEIKVVVEIPPLAETGGQDVGSISATSEGDMTLSKTSILTTTAIHTRLLFLPVLFGGNP